MLITVIAGLFILPFFLFSATAGQLADKYEKSFLIKWTKITEIILMVLTAYAFLTNSLWSLIALLFFMGAQSTFFGPLKYSVLPQHLRQDELIAGNGLINAGTYISILMGTLCGGILVTVGKWGPTLVAWGVVAAALLGYAASVFIPKAEPPSPDIKIDWNVPRATLKMLSFIYPYKQVLRAVLGISWFWLLGSVFLAQFPNFAKDTLGGNEQVSVFFLMLFSVGVGFGSMFCEKVLKGEITAKLVPLGCVGMTVSIVFLCLFSALAERGAHLIGIRDFISRPYAWGITASLVMMAAFGGIFSVPLYALVQAESPAQHRARVIACINIIDSLAMVLGAAFSAALLLMGFSVLNLFLVLASVNLALTPLLARTAGGGGETAKH